jgi:hypothetical protein
LLQSMSAAPAATLIAIPVNPAMSDAKRCIEISL